MICPTLSEFKSWSDDEATVWINSIIAEYNVGLATISRYIFGKESYVHSRAYCRGYIDKLNYRRDRMPPTRSEINRFKDDIRKDWNRAELMWMVLEDIGGRSQQLTRADSVNRQKITYIHVRMTQEEWEEWMAYKNAKKSKGENT